MNQAAVNTSSNPPKAKAVALPPPGEAGTTVAKQKKRTKKPNKNKSLKLPSDSPGVVEEASPTTAISNEINKVNRPGSSKTSYRAEAHPPPPGKAEAGTAKAKKKKGPNRKFSKFPFNRPGIEQEIPTTPNELAARISSITLQSSKCIKKFQRFEDMGLKKKLLKGIYAHGLEKPAKIQRRAIVPCVEGRDAIIQAQSGMGKTAALAISLLERIDLSNPQCQALIVAPTRELAEQICVVFAELGQFLGVSTFTCVGGTNTQHCQAEVQKGKQIIVGTTGRLLHMLMNSETPSSPNFLSLDSLKSLALDEADHMLRPANPKSMGRNFQEDLNEIFRRIPVTTQIILTSATMPEETLRMTPYFMRNPLQFLVKIDELTLEGIQQYYLNCENEEGKFSVLCDIYSQIAKAQGMIFCNTRDKVAQLSKAMEANGHKVSSMSGDFAQFHRNTILREFRRGKGASRMLITSDLLGRGIDVQQVNLIINYDIPQKKEEYIHRVGRGGRYGRNGVAITFITDAEFSRLMMLEEFYQTQIEPMPPVQNLRIFLPPTWQMA